MPGSVVEEVGEAEGAEVEDVVADGYAAAGGLAGWGEDGEGEVLDGEVGVVVGVFDPGLDGRWHVVAR